MIIALVVFMTGALGLAAGSAIVAREISTNGLRSGAALLARSRVEIVYSTCAVAESGTEARGSLLSTWTVSPAEPTSVTLSGNVTYQSSRGALTEPYSVTLSCR